MEERWTSNPVVASPSLAGCEIFYARTPITSFNVYGQFPDLLWLINKSYEQLLGMMFGKSNAYLITLHVLFGWFYRLTDLVQQNNSAFVAFLLICLSVCF